MILAARTAAPLSEIEPCFLRLRGLAPSVPETTLSTVPDLVSRQSATPSLNPT